MTVRPGRHSTDPPPGSEHDDGRAGPVGALARRLRRGRKRLVRNLWLLPEEAPSRSAHLTHLAVLGGVVALVVGVAIVLRLLPPEGRAARLGAATAALALEATIGLYLLERVVSLLYSWPIDHDVLGRSLLARHPVLSLGLAVLIHLATAVSREAFVLFRDPASPAWLQVLALPLLVCTALPAWLILFHPLRFFRASDKVRPPRSSIGARIEDVWWSFRTSLTEFWRDILVPVVREGRILLRTYLRRVRD